MKIKYLGTAAAEGMPGVFCECETCKKSRELGGKNIRTRSQAIIDDSLLIDFPSDTYMHSLLYGIELSKIETCLITHAHFDHLYPDELWCRAPGIAHMEQNPLTLYATHASYSRIANAMLDHNIDDTGRVGLKKMKPFVSFKVQGYTVTPLKARHNPTTDPVIFLIQKDGKNLLYANDTGFFPDETAAYLKNSDVKLDLVSFDCTGGLIPDKDYGKYSHLNLIGDVMMRDLLKENGNLKENTQFVITHFSHNGTPIHEEMEKAASKQGFITAYDGFEIEF